MADPLFDKQDQLDKITALLGEGETLLAVYDGIGAGTGFMAITSKRVIVQDNSFVGKKSAVTSIPYGRIDAVHYVSDKSMFGKFFSSSTVAITVNANVIECSFRGEDKAAYIHNYIIWKITQ